jgi:hypothetical protein
MEEFDLDLNNDMSTPISQLKNKSTLEKHNNNRAHHSDFDNSHITPILNNNTNYEIKRSMMYKENKSKKNKHMNRPMNNFIRNLETNLDNLPIISNKKHDMQPLDIVIGKSRVSFNEDKNEYIPNTCYEGIMVHRDIFISILLFMLLNNKIIIEIIYNYIPAFQRMESPYPNLLLRTLIFGLILYLIKKFKL